jgi:chromosome segregation ATPase
MDDKEFSVTLTGPAKVHGVREKAGKTVTVSPTLALQLAASGVINPELAEQLSNALDMSDAVLEIDFQKAVEDAAAGRIDVLKADHLLDTATLENRIFDLTRDLDHEKETVLTAVSDLQRKDNLLTEERQKVADLETALTNEKQARADADTKLADAQAELAKLAEQLDEKPKTPKTPK